MKLYHYRALNESGKEEAGRIEASDENAALRNLAALGLVAFEISSGAMSASQPWYKRDIHFRSRHISEKEISLLATLLSTLFKAKLTEIEVCRIAGKNAGNRRIARLFERGELLLAEGAPFSKVFENSSLGFPPLFLAFVRVGEKSNALEEVLLDAAKLYADRSKVGQEVRSALVYPMILMVVATALVAMVVFFLAPNLAPLFIANNKALPPVLSALMKTREIFLDNWFFFVIGGASIIVLSLVAGKTDAIQRVIRRFLGRLPILGNALSEAEVAQISRGLSLLLASGLTLPEAFREGQDLAGNGLFSTLFAKAAETVESGASASDLFANARAFPILFVEMYRIGEATNQLPAMMSAVALSLEQSSRQTFERLSQLITPALTFCMGGGIGLLVFSVMSAVLEINEIAF